MLSTINNSVISYQERKSSWCLVSINDVKRRVKIVHIGRGKFKVINDEGTRYSSNIIIGALDIPLQRLRNGYLLFLLVRD